MALGNNNPITQHTTGTLGGTIVFKNVNGKTIMTKKPAPSSKPPSTKQIRCRCIFKVAHLMAVQLLTDPEQLERYTTLAKSRKSPNALTAARRDALRLIYANPSEYEELIAQAVESYTPPPPKTVAGSAAPSGLLISPANSFESLLASAGNIATAAGNSQQLTQQLSDMTNMLNHCLQELQKTMAKANEMLKAINVLNASANETNHNTSSDETTSSNVTSTGTTDTTKQTHTNATTFVRTIDDQTFVPAVPKHDHHMVDETPTTDITTPSEIIASSVPSPFTETQTTGHANNRRQQSLIKSSTGDVLANDFQRYYFPFPGIKQHISTSMLDKIAIIIQGNAPRVHYNPR